MRQNVLFDRWVTWVYVMALMIGCIWHGLDALQGTRAKPGNHLVLYNTFPDSHSDYSIPLNSIQFSLFPEHINKFIIRTITITTTSTIMQEKGRSEDCAYYERLSPNIKFL